MKHIAIIGAGITGLMTALELSKKYKITVIDAGPNPKHNSHTHGATYSGFDARHISYTETAPWTSSHRFELITKNSSEKGWLCIPKNKLNKLEVEWISKFKETSQDTKSHDLNTSVVINLNKEGIRMWELLGNKYDFLQPFKHDTVMPIICRSKDDLLSEFTYEHSLDKRVRLCENQVLPDTLLPFNNRLSMLGGFGYFTLFGSAYYAKSICHNIVEYLSKLGTTFIWDTTISDKHLLSSDYYFENLKADALVCCSGVSLDTTQLLSKFNVLLAGVIGCWVEVDNPGIKVACKIYGPEPVNYINITPSKTSLLLSGGYGFVGSRPHNEASLLAKPIMDDMLKEVKQWLPDSTIKATSYCIRPATPTGVPTLVVNHKNKLPIIIAVGHSAGGFTQSPVTAISISKEISSNI